MPTMCQPHKRESPSLLGIEATHVFAFFRNVGVYASVRQVRMAGSQEDGQTVLNFKSFIKKTGIARTEPSAAPVDYSEGGERDTSSDQDQVDSGCDG